MQEYAENLKRLMDDLEKAKDYFFKKTKILEAPVHIYTHIDADGIAAGAILGKALYRAKIPFQITVLRQLEKEEILKIVNKEFNNFLIFSDFGSGQYIELQEKLIEDSHLDSFLILDHHFPQNINNKEEHDLIDEIHKKTVPWHINPYFYGIDGSIEVSGAGLCYYFAKALNEINFDLSPVAIVGAIGDIQNRGPNKSFIGLNSLIVDEAKRNGYIEIIDDLNFSSIKPLNEAIAYSSEIKLPGLSKEINKTLKFLQTLGILMENSDGNIRTLNDLNKDEKQKISSAIIEYGSLKLDIEPNEIIKKLIVNRYLIKEETGYSALYDTNEFAYVLNACGRTNNASLGIAIAMGDRKIAYKQAHDIILNYKNLLVKGLSWIKDNNKIHQMDFIQYFFGKEVIPEKIIGTIASMLVLDRSQLIDIMKPVFGIANREDENTYKISGRAHEELVNRGVNLSEAIRDALELINLDSLGGGHPPAAGTKVPVEKIEVFLEKCNEVIKRQLERKI